jgi:peptide/nickel transport system permease protein
MALASAPTDVFEGAEAPPRRLLRDLAADPAAVLGIALLALIVLCALAAPWLAPQDPQDLARLDLADASLPPASRSASGTLLWLGSDARGRDVLSAILYGLRLSLAIGVASTLLALSIGLALGLAAACRGGRALALLTGLVDVQLAFPGILIALFLVAVIGQGSGTVVAALVAVQWAHYARTARAAAAAETGKTYVEAARGLALPASRVVLGHLLPNCLPPVVVAAARQLACAIALEATLSFLGLGLPVTQPSLGLAIADGYPDLLAGRYWTSVFPGVALLVTIFAIHRVGDRLREVLA